MALIKLSGIISDIQGCIGGTVFQKSSSGLVARNKPTNINKLSSLQVNRRNITSNLQNKWMGLTNTQRNEWQLFSKYHPIGQKNISGRFINGQQTFILINYYRILYSETVLLSPIFQPYIHAPVTISFAWLFDTLRCITSEADLYVSSYLILFCSIPVSLSVYNPRNKLRLMQHILQSGVSQNITTAYENVFGFIPVQNDYIFAKWSIGDKTTGIIQPFQTGKFQIT